VNRFAALLAFLILQLAGAPALAQAGGRHMDVRLVAETGAAMPGSTVTLAFVMRPQPGACPRAGRPGRYTIRCPIGSASPG
jgi:hypothetical protein